MKFKLKILIANEEVIVTITHKGYLKRMPSDTYKAQKRGGKGVKGASSEDDFFTSIFLQLKLMIKLCSLVIKELFIPLKVYEIPEGSRTSKGRNIVNLLPLKTGEKIREIISVPKDFKDKYLVIATEGGTIKKTKLDEYSNVKQSGIKAIKVQDDDSVISVRVTDGKKDVLLCATSGKIITICRI
jgi:DNA gyrase subunit A